MNGVREDIARGELPCIKKNPIDEDPLKKLDANINYLKGQIMKMYKHTWERILNLQIPKEHFEVLKKEVNDREANKNTELTQKGGRKRKTKRKKSKNLKKTKKNLKKTKKNKEKNNKKSKKQRKL